MTMGKQKSCATCLWCWPEIHGDGTYRCYKPGSHSYHEIPAYPCANWETKAWIPAKEQYSCWGSPGREYKKSKKGWHRNNG